MENIIPALPQTNEKSLKELSPQEFQKLLSCWFEEKGIVHDMKSYLKFQMINVLNNTVIGNNMRKFVPQTHSLSQQAINLVVAEYLLRNQCHFTLSLFSNEVNLTNILPQQKLLFCNGGITNEITNIFDKENLINILELIGIPKENGYFMNIFNQYFDDGMSSLLSCLINVIGKNIEEHSSNVKECKTDIEYEDDFISNIFQVIQTLNLPHTTQHKLFHNIKLFYGIKCKLFEDQCIKLINKFKKELSLRNKKFRTEEKQKREMEKILLKLQEENESLKEKINLLKENEAIQNEKKVPPSCYLNHCDKKCNEARRLCETYKNEVELLRNENSNQKEDIHRLSVNCNELLKEFSCCQSKINLVNTRIQEDNFDDLNLFATAQVDKNIGNISTDSETTATEEILQQARHKLKLLEEESKELDIRFSKFVIK